MEAEELRLCPACRCYCIAVLFVRTKDPFLGAVCDDCASDEDAPVQRPLQLVGGLSAFGVDVLGLREDEL